MGNANAPVFRQLRNREYASAKAESETANFRFHRTGLPIADDNDDFRFSFVALVIPATDDHFSDALRLALHKILPFRLAHAQQRRFQKGVIRRKDILGHAGQRVYIQRYRLPYFQSRMFGEDSAKRASISNSFILSGGAFRRRNFSRSKGNQSTIIT